ncbi:28084_t:CDS:2, partial [Gigaspora margarita]
NEIPEHIDEHYCLHIVKNAKLFAHTFVFHSVIISQDDKAKVPLGIPAIRKMFKILQTAHEPVEIPDHNFSKGSIQKLIPSVYLTIDMENLNNLLHNGQLSIFIHPQWFNNTSSLTHMVDLMLMMKNPALDNKLILENEFKPILVLFINGGPDENPSMSTFSEKLASIVLPINYFGSYLNSSSIINNTELANKNFCYTSEKLCDLWKRDHIYDHKVFVEYIDQKIDPFSKTKCKDFNCCSVWGAEEVAALLAKNKRFLLPAAKGRDGYYLSPIHILQYMNKLKIPGFDQYCSSISSKLYS